MKRLILLGLIFIGTTANAVTYNIEVLGSLSAGGGSSARALNESGQVVGSSYNDTSGEWEAVVWNSSVVTSLGFTGTARDINDSGTIVGETGATAYRDDIINQGRAFRYENGVYTDLGDLNGSYASATGINNSGVISGTSYTNYETTGVFQAHGFRYTNGVMTDLGQVAGQSVDGYSRGEAINAAGEIVGRGSVTIFTGSEKHQIHWDASNNLTQTVGPYDYSAGYDINTDGTIAGTVKNASGQRRAAIWENGAVNVLDMTFGGSFSKFFALNDAGIAVGFAHDADDNKLASISLDGVTLIDLSTLVNDMSGWTSLDQAYDINGSGQIVGVGTLATGEQGAFLLSATTVPIPAAVWLFASALGLLGWSRRNRH